jgi:hypothetical protein
MGGAYACTDMYMSKGKLDRDRGVSCPMPGTDVGESLGIRGLLYRHLELPRSATDRYWALTREIKPHFRNR